MHYNINDDLENNQFKGIGCKYLKYLCFTLIVVLLLVGIIFAILSFSTVYGTRCPFEIKYVDNITSSSCTIHLISNITSLHTLILIYQREKTMHYYYFIYIPSSNSIISIQLGNLTSNHKYTVYLSDVFNQKQMSNKYIFYTLK